MRDALVQTVIIVSSLLKVLCATSVLTFDSELNMPLRGNQNHVWLSGLLATRVCVLQAGSQGRQQEVLINGKLRVQCSVLVISSSPARSQSSTTSSWRCGKNGSYSKQNVKGRRQLCIMLVEKQAHKLMELGINTYTYTYTYAHTMKPMGIFNLSQMQNWLCSMPYNHPQSDWGGKFVITPRSTCTNESGHTAQRLE